MWLYLQKPSLMVQELKSKTYTSALPRNTKHVAIDGQVYFHRWLIADPVKTPRCTTGSVEPVNGINKDVSGVRLLQTLSQSILYIESLSVTFWRHSNTVCVKMEDITCLWLPTHPNHPPAPYNMPSVILQSLWKNCSKSSSVS